MAKSVRDTMTENPRSINASASVVEAAGDRLEQFGLLARRPEEDARLVHARFTFRSRDEGQRTPLRRIAQSRPPQVAKAPTLPLRTSLRIGVGRPGGHRPAQLPNVSLLRLLTRDGS